jgi:hypothetical protein
MTMFLLGILYHRTRIVHNNTAVRSIHHTVLFVVPKCMVLYCVNTHTMALESTQPVTETNKCKGKAIPLQALTGPEGSRSSRLPDFKIIGT